MGKRKFKVSDMIPNAWFHKLFKDIPKSLYVSTTTTTPPAPPPSSTTQLPPRKSYHFTRDLPLHQQQPADPPRKSKSTSRKTASKSPENHRLDIIMDSSPAAQLVDSSSLPNVITKGPTATSRRFSVSSPGGVRLKVNSPRITGSRKQQGQIQYRRKKSSSASTSTSTSSSIWESLAVVKSSNDPQRDFRESMVEMIVQNSLWSSKDLEDLLACYLSLNSDEYHHVIIKVFKQIWHQYHFTQLKQHQIQ